MPQCFRLDVPSCCRRFSIELSEDIRINSQKPSQCTRIDASASLLNPADQKQTSKDKTIKISTKTSCQRSYFIFNADYESLSLHLYKSRLAWVNVNHQNIIFCFDLILSANPFERFPSGLWLQFVDKLDGNGFGMQRRSWLALFLWVDTVSA